MRLKTLYPNEYIWQRLTCLFTYIDHFEDMYELYIYLICPDDS